MSEIDRLTKLAITRLGLVENMKTQEAVKEILSENGIQSKKFTACISRIEKMHQSDRRDVYGLLTRFYQDAMMTIDSVDCDYCRKSGWLKVVLITGQYAGYEKTWIYNSNQPEKHDEFLKENGTFKARATLMPCTCDNGTLRNNTLHGAWLNDDQRKLVLARSVKRYDASPDDCEVLEYYYQEEIVNKINGIKEGLNISVRNIKSYPPIEVLRKKFNEMELI